MGIIRSAYRVLSEEGIIPFVSASFTFLKNRVIEYVPHPLYKRIIPSKVKLRVNNIESTFDTSIITSNVDFRNDFHSEKTVISTFITDLKQDDVIYDIGANVGIYSSFAGQVTNDGLVICFEPHPVAVPVLHQNLSMNCQNFEIVQVGASIEEGYGKMQPDFSTGANIKTDSGINVKLERVKDVIKQNSFPKPTVAKIDVEGAELDVLKGFGHILEDLELVYLEIHHMRVKKFKSDKESVIDILNSNFDTVVELEQHDRGDGTQTHIKATSR